HRVIGSTVVLREQLAHLATLSRQPRITVRVVPNEGGKHGAFGSFELIRQPDRPSAVFVEQATSLLIIEQRNEINFYGRILKRLLDDALDERESLQRVVNAATRLDKEERTV